MIVCSCSDIIPPITAALNTSVPSLRSDEDEEFSEAGEREQGPDRDWFVSAIISAGLTGHEGIFLINLTFMK